MGYFNKVSELKKELIYLTSRSSGPGGQNVNKLETKVTVQWHIASSEILTESQKNRLLDKLQDKLNAQGFLAVTDQSSRSQLGNKEEAVNKLVGLVEKVLHIPKARKKTKPSKSAVAERLESKKKQADKKTLRGKVTF